jgi:hypothetical protein
VAVTAVVMHPVAWSQAARARRGRDRPWAGGYASMRSRAPSTPSRSAQ